MKKISKTIGVGATPIGNTVNNIQHIIEQDEKRKSESVIIKDILDVEHRKFIENKLRNYKISPEEICSYAKSIGTDDCEKIKNRLIKNLCKYLKGDEILFGAKSIDYLLETCQDEQNKEIIRHFKGFTCFLNDYFKARENLYTEKVGSVAYRIMSENLPMFIDNIDIFNKSFPETEEWYSRYENFCYVLTMDGITEYNTVVGEINSKINENNQCSNTKNPLMHRLYNLPLFESEKPSWLQKEYESDEEVIESVKASFNDYIYPSFGKLVEKFKGIELEDAENIQINGKKMIFISKEVYGKELYIEDKILDKKRSTQIQKPRETAEKYEARLRKEISKTEIFSVAEIMDACDDNNVFYYIKNFGAIDNERVQTVNYMSQIESAFNTLMDTFKNEGTKLRQNDANSRQFEKTMETLNNAKKFVSCFQGNETTTDFNDFVNLEWQNISIVKDIYDKSRNWITKKPYSSDKLLLTFNCSSFLGGWVDESANCAAIFMDKKGKYFLGFREKIARFKPFENAPKPMDENDTLFMMELKQGGDMSKNVQNLLLINGKVEKKNGRSQIIDGVKCNCLLEEYKNTYLPEEINRIRKERTFSRGSENFSKKDLVTFIDYYKTLVPLYYKEYSFVFKDSSEYYSFESFTDHLNEQSYQISFKPISKAYILDMVEKGKYYLFEVTTKDIGKKRDSTPDIHAMYFNALFDEKNLDNVVYRLCGGAQFYYRKHSIDEENAIIHKANIPFPNKNGGKSLFPYDIVKDRRYVYDSFHFHIPIECSCENSEYTYGQALENNEIKHFIGIDRGERNLIYAVVTDTEGNIVEQKCLNTVNGVDYKKKLVERDRERKERTKVWQNKGKIVDIKKGYISQVIHELCLLRDKYNAVFVLENLNSGFKKLRTSMFEFSVYDEFEKALVSKLEFYVDKKKDAFEKGGLYNPLSMADTASKNTYRNGFVHFVNPSRTSNIDPVTGFVNLFGKQLVYKNIDETKKFFGNFDFIRYNAEKDYFEFVADYSKFGINKDGCHNIWKICTNGTRIQRAKNNLGYFSEKEVNLTESLKSLLTKKGIGLNENLKNALSESKDKELLENMLFLFRLTLQMRNSISNTDVDYIISPIADVNGTFFDSRNGNKSLPMDADANGAFNIARKGIIAFNKQKGGVSDAEWLSVAQARYKG